MSKNKDAAQALQHQDGREQIKLAGFDELPDTDCITGFSPAQGTIAALLPREWVNAITTRELAQITGRKPREITKAVCAERRNGAPIISDACGFWLASDADELRRCTMALHRRAGEIHRTAHALEKLVDGR